MIADHQYEQILGNHRRISTIHGLVDESELRHAPGKFENENEHTTWDEYYLGEQLVHRSAHVRLKKGLGIEGVLGSFG